MTMNGNRLTCEEVDARDLDTRYVSGRLTAEEAASFEEHYFECDRCWTLVQRGVELRSLAPTSAANRRQAAAKTQRRWSGAAWIGLTAAAVVAVVGIRQWRTGAEAPAAGSPMTVRGFGDTLVVAPTVTGRGLGVVWNRLDGASAYRVRLFTRSGDVIVEEELADTSFVLSWERLPARSDDSLFWQVQALDQLRAPLGRSPLAPTSARPPTPR